MIRRDFLKTGIAAGAAMTISGTIPKTSAATQIESYNREGQSPSQIAQDEAFWKRVRRDFGPAPDFVNLEYGYFCPATLATLEEEIAGGREINSRASFYMRRTRTQDLEDTRTELAKLAGTSPEELCITRNTTESLNTIIQGIDMDPGDEIVYSNQDYGSMVQAMKQKAKRFGVVLKEVSIPLHPKSDEEIVAVFENAITNKTKLLHVTHMINLTGHVLPVRKICDMAHAREVEVVLDSAHAFSHIDFKISELNCDYLGTSLHKWTCSPVGLGLLYVKKEKIPKVWGLMGDVIRPEDDIRKLERIGTRPYNHMRGLRNAIRYHDAIGSKTKQERLRYLNTYWTQHFRNHDRVYINTPVDPNRHGAIANVGIRGVEPQKIAEFFYNKYSILTVGISGHSIVKGVRVTPGLPTSLRHLHLFIEAVEDAANTL
ncbi:aminotransferase class V-fold PLP-dependent enzyme [Puniceicoccaceae bacterium K14]|nr:aminotransferase class V-fold PLP-dependent enzyme [Puniceicoccaceae bacterium K14]